MTTLRSPQEAVWVAEALIAVVEYRSTIPNDVTVGSCWTDSYASHPATHATVSNYSGYALFVDFPPVWGHHTNEDCELRIRCASALQELIEGAHGRSENLRTIRAHDVCRNYVREVPNART
jgi:hypothetical protein